MVKQARAAVTREQILRGAAEVFDRYGYGAATLSDVIAQAGVTKGALYFHFSSKEDLARTVIEQQHALSVRPARQRLDEHAPGLESVIRLSQGLAGQLMEDVVVRAGIRLTLEQGTFGASVSNPYRDWVAVTEQLLRRAIDEGDLRDSIKPAALARLAVGAFTGVQLLSEVLSGRQDLYQRVEEMWDILLPSLVSARKLPYFRSVAATGPSRQGGKFGSL
ncbi:MAG TPA: ScbR family autoregulator-binding transcription factor [Pseudonocardiaceae bacterium]|nr:ScbR family autoregulator-binding transcription factor [Pseudonocardiaceae bacterium]